MAMLLDGVSFQFGPGRFIHRELEDCRPNDNFCKGRVINISEEDFTVRVWPEKSKSPNLGRRISARLSFRNNDEEEGAGPRNSVQRRLSGNTQPVSPTCLGSSEDDPARLGSRASHGPQGALDFVDHVFPLAGRKLSAQDLLSMANSSLRVIDWTSISLELLSATTVCGKVGGDYSYSRPLKHGEKIDFFLSHSWHDNAEHKWIRLQEVVILFLKEHGRYPTFWLDKTCIDQENIADGLKVLPMNIVACRSVLALVGDTYPNRLWCVWELFTLFAFAKEDSARSKMQIMKLGEGSDEMVYGPLLQFATRKAHCYDPNEEARLRRIIDTVGAQKFETCIQRLTRLCIGAKLVLAPTVRKSRSLKTLGVMKRQNSHASNDDDANKSSFFSSRSGSQTRISKDAGDKKLVKKFSNPALN